MARGMSIHVGVNKTKAPGLNVAKLRGCANDADAMLRLARSRNFTKVGGGEDVAMIDGKATFADVLGRIRIAAAELVAGDIFLFTFSGHGTRRGAEDPVEVDLKDETLVLSDKLLIDNVLRRSIWPKFKPGVRVVMVSDSCHSGGAAMSRVDHSESSDDDPSTDSGAWSGTAVCRTRTNRPPAEPEFRDRTISPEEAGVHFAELATFYKELRDSLPKVPPPIAANVLLLAACEEHETTRDGPEHGVFTKALLDVWDPNGSQTYDELREAIAERLAETGESSTPIVMSIGDSPVFSDTAAFRI